MYVMGIDGGGTKTQCLITDLNGQVKGEGFGGEANYQLCGKEIAEASIRTAINHALNSAGIEIKEVKYAVFGLSGADEPLDFEVLEPICKSIMGEIPHEVLNDTWIGLASGSPYGVVSICGTGAAHAGVTPDGVRHILRNLDYELGNKGGGGEIVSQALHYAFRSDELTYKKTKLETVIPEVFGVKSLDEVSMIIREKWIPKDVAFQIPIKVFALANEGDEVATEIIRDMGRTEGLYAAGVIKKLGLEDLEVPMVLIGSLFKTDNPILTGAYMDAVHEIAPKAVKVIPTVAPVEGAIQLAIKEVQNA